MRAKPYTLIVLLLLLPASAFAYIDPGSGMLIWQGVIAAIGAVVVFFRDPWQSIKRLWQRIRRK